MSDIGVEQVLAQMRVLAAQARGPAPAEDVQATDKVDFSRLLKQSIDAVNELQQDSGDLKKRIELGDQTVSMVDVAVASEKAKVAFTAMTEVRNRLIQAYQEVLNMPI